MSCAARRDYLLLSLVAALNSSCLAMFFQLPRHVKSLGGNEDYIGVLLGMTLFPIMFCSTWAAGLINKVKLRGVLMAGVLIFTLGTVIHVFIDALGPALFAGRAVQGLGYTLIFIPCFTVVVSLVPDRFKSQGIAYFVVSLQAGNVAGSLAGGLVMEHASFVQLVWLGTAVSLACALPAFWVRFAPAGNVPAPHGGSILLRVAQQRTLVAGYLIVLLLGGIYSTLLQFMPTYLDALLAAGVIERPIPSATFLSAALLCVGASRILMGKVGDGPRRFQIMSVCYAGLLLSLLLIIHIRGPWMVLLAALIFGFSHGLLFPALNAVLIVRAPPAWRAGAVGLLGAIFPVGYNGISFLTGPISSAYGYAVMYYFLTALLLVCGALFLWLESERGIWAPRWFARP